MSAISLKTVAAVAVVALAALLMAACGRQGLLPEAGGRPSEVLVAGDTCSIVAQALSADAAGLPQPEPIFDVVTTSSPRDGLGPQERLYRNIVLVSIDGTRRSTTTVQYERNVYAHGQIVISVCSPSAAALRRDVARCGLLRLLFSNEMLRHATWLRRHADTAVSREVGKALGCDILVPTGMTVNKRGQGFVWLSDNATPVMRNICLYLSDNRDSVMAANIKGETDGMHMTTVPGTTVETTVVGSGGQQVSVRRGLWQMTGDSMGGPYVARAVTAQGRHVVAEAFVFAPGKGKRDVMRQLEASLLTLSVADGCK